MSFSPKSRTERRYAVIRTYVSVIALSPMSSQQKDSALSLASTVQQDLSMNLSNRWTETKRPISRPARPPDLTPRTFL